MNEAALYTKCKKVYNSCETKEHYKVAYNYISLAYSKMKNNKDNMLILRYMRVLLSKVEFKIESCSFDN